MKSSRLNDGTDRAWLDPGARKVLLVAGLMAVVVAVYHATFASMVQLWSVSAYHHGYVVVPVTLWLLWRDRARLVDAPVRGSGLGLIAVVALSLAWLASVAAAIQTLEHLVAVLLIAAFVLAVLGWPAFRSVAFPMLFLVFAAPFGDEVTPLLVNATADVSEMLFNLFGVPALREGPYFTLPGGSFLVADVCSGFKNLTAGVFIAVLGGYLLFHSWWKRVLFVVLTAVSYVFTNGLRAFITMAVASATDGRVLAGQDHVYFGWVIFCLLMVLVVWVASRHADPPRDAAVAVAPAALLPDRPLQAATAGLLAVALMLVGPVLHHSSTQATGHVEVPALPALDGCTGPNEWSLPWLPAVEGADAQTAGSYACAGYDVHLYWAGFVNQRQGRELVNARNRVLPSGHGRILPGTAGAFVDAAETHVETNAARIASGPADLDVWYWYEVGAEPVRRRSDVKLREAFGALSINATVSSVSLVAVSPRAPDTEVQRAGLEQGARALRAATGAAGDRLPAQ